MVPFSYKMIKIVKMVKMVPFLKMVCKNGLHTILQDHFRENAFQKWSFWPFWQFLRRRQFYSKMVKWYNFWKLYHFVTEPFCGKMVPFQYKMVCLDIVSFTFRETFQLQLGTASFFCKRNHFWMRSFWGSHNIHFCSKLDTAGYSSVDISIRGVLFCGHLFHPIGLSMGV